MAPAAYGLLGRIRREDEKGPPQYGPNSAQVTEFIGALRQLTPAQWRKVGSARRRLATVTKEDVSRPDDEARSIEDTIRNADGGLPEPMSKAGQALLRSLGRRRGDAFVAAWHAVSALVARPRMPALKFAAHYAPFAETVPLANPQVDATAKRFLSALERLTPAQCEVLARPWRLEHDDSRALLQASAKSKSKETEEAAALAALQEIPTHLAGDAGWAAVKTAVHGGRVLSCRVELSREQLAVLWSPLEAAIPLASLNDARRPKRPRPGAGRAAPTAPKPARPAKSAAPGPAEPAAAPAVETPAVYGPNSTEVASFVIRVLELSPIQWLRILDRRQLVASVTREGAEPAGVVRSILAAIHGSSGLDSVVRCTIFAAVERAAFAVEAKARLSSEQIGQYYAPFEWSIPLEQVDAGGFAARLAALSPDEWSDVAKSAPAANEKVVEPLVNAGTALVAFLAGRSDEEAVATWLAVSSLVRRHHLTPIKFAASYAPFASAIPVTLPKDLGENVQRFVTAVGRLSLNQCSLLAQPWQLDDELSNVLSKAVADGSARAGEEAAAMAALVTVPMRMSGNDGWAAVKTAAFGGRVLASRSRLSNKQVEALWKPIQPAIQLASLESPAKPAR